MGIFSSRPAPSYSSPYSSSATLQYVSFTNVFLTIGLAIGLFAIAYIVYNTIKSGGKSLLPGTAAATDQTPTVADGKTTKTISAATIPAGATNSGLQFWMYIKDWDYKYNEEKQVIQRKGSGNILGPQITLHPTDNTLVIRTSIYPASAQEPDVFTCSVENVPLPSWFSVSVTIFDRNLDAYINGRLVKSCVLPGVPKIAAGDVVLAENGGFSGSLCNVHVYPQMLSPDDAKAFFQGGTTCGQPAMTTYTPSGTEFSLFGYKFRLTVFDKYGKQSKEYNF